MRRQLLLLVTLFLMTATISAQQQHPFEVQRLSDWAPDYLTWTCSYYYQATPWTKEDDISRQLLQLKDLKKEDYIWIDQEKSTNLPRLGCIVRAIDGLSTKDMSLEQFYAVVAKSNTHKLTYVDPREKKGQDVNQCTLVLRDTPFWMEQLGFKPFSTGSLDTRPQRRKVNLHGNLDVVCDNEVDWSRYRTYDFALRGNDPLNDKKLLQIIAKNFDYNMSRDIENPDVLFTIATNTDQSISTTYVPPVVQTIRTGSTTQTRYNWITKKNDYVTNDNYRTVREEGYTKSDKSVTLFMEFAILDAAKVKEAKSEVPPIVYQATFKRDLVNPDFNTRDEYLAVASWLDSPFVDRLGTGHWFDYEIGKLTPNGMYVEALDKGKTYRVKKIITGSEAEQAGLKVGDCLTKLRVVDGNFEFVIKKGKEKRTVVLPSHGQSFLLPHSTMQVSITGMDMN
mgnify:CR=1 FL=1